MGEQTQSTVFGEVLKAQTLGSVIEDKVFFSLFGSRGQCYRRGVRGIDSN